MRLPARSALLGLCLPAALSVAACQPEDPPDRGENAMTPGLLPPPAKGIDAPPPVDPAPGAI